MALDKQALRERINGHPLLALPPEERLANTRLRMELTDLVLQYKAFDRLLAENIEQDTGSEQSEEKDDTAQDADESAEKNEPRNTQHTVTEWYDRQLGNALYTPRTRTAAYDGLALAEAVQKAVKGYRAGSGAAFLTYFDRVYDRELVQAARTNENIGQSRLTLTAGDRNLIRSLNRLMEHRPGVDPNRPLPAAVCQELADVLDITPARVRQLWKLSRTVRQATVSLDQPKPGEDKDSEQVQVADPKAEDPQAYVERLELLDRLLRLFADLDAREYPRLFLNNDILRPLKESAVPDTSYQAMLTRHAEQLFRHVFELPYLAFVLELAAPPATVAAIAAAPLRRPLQSRTIAEYKGVSKAAVSQQLAAYRRLLQAIEKDL